MGWAYTLHAGLAKGYEGEVKRKGAFGNPTLFWPINKCLKRPGQVLSMSGQLGPLRWSSSLIPTLGAQLREQWVGRAPHDATWRVRGQCLCAEDTDVWVLVWESLCVGESAGEGERQCVNVE